MNIFSFDWFGRPPLQEGAVMLVNKLARQLTKQ